MSTYSKERERADREDSPVIQCSMRVGQTFINEFDQFGLVEDCYLTLALSAKEIGIRRSSEKSGMEQTGITQGTSQPKSLDLIRRAVRIHW